MITALPSVQDAMTSTMTPDESDLYGRREGFIYTFQQKRPSHLSLLAKIPPTLAAHAGYFGKGKKGFERFFLAVPARADHGAEILIYTVPRIRRET